MKSLILRDVLTPVATRIGTALSGYLVGSELAGAELANHAGAVLAAVVLVTVDLVLSGIARYKREKAIKTEAAR